MRKNTTPVVYGPRAPTPPVVYGPRVPKSVLVALVDACPHRRPKERAGRTPGTAPARAKNGIALHNCGQAFAASPQMALMP